MTRLTTLNRRQILAATLASAALSSSPLAFAQKSTRVLRIGHQKGWLSILKGRGTLEKRLVPLGVSVTWTEFNAGPVQLEALNVGAIDFGDRRPFLPKPRAPLWCMPLPQYRAPNWKPSSCPKGRLFKPSEI